MQIPRTTKRSQQNAQAAWRRSRACANTECVEVAALAGEVAMRSSQSPNVILTFTEAEWRQFVLGVKAGDFDDVLGVG
jgi:hypothetical protein